MRVLPNTFDRLWSDCGDDVLGAVARVGESGWYILGSEVAAFETALADWSNVPHVVGVANGMDALEIALRIKGIGPGDKVVTTPLSAFPTSLSITRSGAIPVFADTDHHGLLDPQAVNEAFETHPDIKAIIPVHLYGQLADMDALHAIAEEKGVFLFEDAAQAIGAQRGQLQVGSLKTMASISFYPTKNLGVIGDGGALFLHDESEAKMARAIRNYGQTEKYVHDIEGLNSRLDEVHAATLTDAFLPRLGSWLNTRRRIAREYLGRIETQSVCLMPGPDPAGSGWHLFPVLVAPDRRDAFIAYLVENGVGAAIHYPILMPDQRALTQSGAPLRIGELKRARQIATSEVSLPIHPYLSAEEQTHVINCVNAWEG